MRCNTTVDQTESLILTGLKDPLTIPEDPPRHIPPHHTHRSLVYLLTGWSHSGTHANPGRWLIECSNEKRTVPTLFSCFTFHFLSAESCSAEEQIEITATSRGGGAGEAIVVWTE